MSTTIEVNKKSVKELLSSGKQLKFVIPEYQRPYAWTEDQVQTLFDDLAEFTRDVPKDDSDDNSTYFLGTIVSYENDNREQEIIDGQQRITSLFLLLRAIYRKIEEEPVSPQSTNFKSQIESALWAQQNALTAEVDKNKTLITSKVIGDEGNDIFHNILVTGDTDPEATDNYSTNYNIFRELLAEYAKVETLNFYWFINSLLNKAILLPITADSQDTALTIFSTLNDRGLALSDADIFKAKIYNHLNSEEKQNFIAEWQELDEDARNSNESIQKLFYYYMFYLRAKENDRNTTTPGIRKYYSKNGFSRLYDKDIMSNLKIVLQLWTVVNTGNGLNEPWSKNIELLQTLDALKSYPNEFWKYPVVIYYLMYHETEQFAEDFLRFLRKLLANLSARYIVTPTINVVKRGILNLNAEIINSPNPKFGFSTIDEHELKSKIKNAHRNTVRMILKMIAYDNKDQVGILPDKWEIEHILPQKWQNSFFPNQTEGEVKELVEHIGNKIPFEKRLNIIASNGYFAKKKESYVHSNVKLVTELAKDHSEWNLDEIRERDLNIANELYDLLLAWGLNQDDGTIVNKYKVAIPDDKQESYNLFLQAFGKDDTDEARSQFLSVV